LKGAAKSGTAERKAERKIFPEQIKNVHKNVNYSDSVVRSSLNRLHLKEKLEGEGSKTTSTIEDLNNLKIRQDGGLSSGRKT